MTTFSTNTYTGIVLTSPSVTNPVTVASGTYITNNGTSHGGTGIFGAGIAWTITNYGTIQEQQSTSGAGIYLGAGGTVINKGSVDSNHTGVSFKVLAAYLNNAGLISAVQASTSGVGVYLGAGGKVVNTSTISSVRDGIYNTGGALTATNTGLIESTGSATAIYSNAGGVITNASGGVIQSARTGISFTTTAGTLVNDGTVISTATGTSGVGVYLGNGGLITNAGTALIQSGRAAISIAKNGTATADATVVNHGRIIGSFGVFIASSGATGNNTIINYGTIQGTAGTAIALGALGDKVVIETNSALYGVVSNFHPGDTFDLPFLAFDPSGIATVVSNGTVTNQLQVIESSGTAQINLDATYNFSGFTFSLSDDGNNKTLVSENVACFRRGTRIRTPKGDVAVERLAIGGKVVTFSGAARPIRWIGKRAYDPRFAAGNRTILPICVTAGALADGVPARDLWVSPEHAFYLDGLLLPAALLVNGSTIYQEESVAALEYFHLELDGHDVILAEGTPAETYVDCDNRTMFHNAPEFATLYPGDAPPRWEFCAPRLLPDSPEVAALRAPVLARAEMRGRMTTDPDLHLIAGGRIVPPQSVADRTYLFALPAEVDDIVIASRRAIPAQIEAGSTDGRLLGVALDRIVLHGAGMRFELGHDCPVLADGFHPPEATHRWTDGRGRLPEALLRALAGDPKLEVHLAETVLHYPLATATAAKPAAHVRKRGRPRTPNRIAMSRSA